MPDEGVEQRWLERALAHQLCQVDERSRRILSLRWGLFGTRPHTLEQTGRRLGISGERVRQLENAALRELSRCSQLRALTRELD